MEHFILLLPLIAYMAIIIYTKMNNENDEKIRQLNEVIERMNVCNAGCESDIIDKVNDSQILTEDQIWHKIHDPIELELYPIYKSYESKVQTIPKKPSTQPAALNHLNDDICYVNNQFV